jgi:hypothetical protein
MFGAASAILCPLDLLIGYSASAPEIISIGSFAIAGGSFAAAAAANGCKSPGEGAYLFRMPLRASVN